MPDQPPRTKLPRGVPDTLKDFVRCRTNEVELEAGDLTWLPKPDTGGIPVPDVTPGLTFENGLTPGSVTISVGWGFFNISVTGTIRDGKLNVDAPAIPGLGSQITGWVNDLNADLEANGMQVGDLSIRNGKLHFGKEAIPVAPTTETAVVPAPVTQVAVPSPTPTPAPAVVPGPAPGSKTAGFLDDWKKKAAVGGGALALGVAAFFIFVDDGQPPGQLPPATTAAPAAATGSTPLDGSSTDTNGSTTDDAEGSETPPDTPVDPPPDTDPPDDDSFGSLQLPDGFYGGLDQFAEDAGAVGTRVMIHSDAVGDVDFCTTSEGFGADITGVIAFQDGNLVTAFVGTAQSPMDSLSDFSWALQFQPEFASGAYRMFVRQVHDGEHSEGEQLPDGTLDPEAAVEIGITENGLLFRFEVDESDPLAVGTAFGFNLPQDGDAIGCDQAVAAVSPPAIPITVGSGSCTDSDTVTCLGGRFSTEVTADGASATGVAQSDDLAWFSFSDTAQVDLTLQIVNGCSFGDHYWVFAAAATDVAFDVIVTDTATGEVRSYSNPAGMPFDAVTDTAAFATCP